VPSSPVRDALQENDRKFLISCAFGMQIGRLNNTGNSGMFVEKFKKKPLNFQLDKGPSDIIIPKKNVFLSYLFPSNLE
jgi:hypothetical protein